MTLLQVKQRAFGVCTSPSFRLTKGLFQDCTSPYFKINKGPLMFAHHPPQVKQRAFDGCTTPSFSLIKGLVIIAHHPVVGEAKGILCLHITFFNGQSSWDGIIQRLLTCLAFRTLLWALYDAIMRRGIAEWCWRCLQIFHGGCILQPCVVFTFYKICKAMKLFGGKQLSSSFNAL